MSAWTNGTIHVVAGPAGLSVHRGDQVQLILATSQLGELAPIKKSKIARLRPLAVNDGAQVAFTTDAERFLVRASLGSRPGSLKFPWDIRALAPAEGQRVFAAYVTGTKARALTSIVLGVPPADPKGKWEHEYESDKPQKVDWPDELLWEKAPWSRKTRWATDPDLIEIDANAHAYTVYDVASAVVGVLRRPGPGKAPEGFACVLRTPKDKGSTVSATATARGVLVATCTVEGKAVLVEFDDTGKILAHRELEAKKIAPLSLAGGRVFAVVENREVLILGEDLQDQARVELPNLPASQLSLRPAADGASFLLGVQDRVLRGTLVGGSWSIEPIELAVPAPSETHEAPIAEAELETPPEAEGGGPQPGDGRTRIITQAPRLDLNPDQPNDAWTFAAGTEFEIELRAVSAGGPSETGLYVEVSGDALTKGLLEPLSVIVEGHSSGTATFETKAKLRVAQLPELLIPAGVEPIKDKKVKAKERYLDNPEDTFLTIRLQAKALKPGSELVYVRVGFDGTEEGKLMRGRPLTIT